MIIRRMYLWSFRALTFLSAGELESTFILWGLSGWKASEGNMGFVGEMNFLSVKTDFCSCDKYGAKAFKEKKKRKKGVSFGQGFHFGFQLLHLLGVSIRYLPCQP